MDYISREDATEALIRHSMHISDTWQTDYRGEVAGIDMAVCIIEDLPAADVPERNVGKWEQCSDSMMVCSECGKYWIPDDERYDFNYCPHCGAKME